MATMARSATALAVVAAVICMAFIVEARVTVKVDRNQVNLVRQTANQNANVGNNNEIEADAVSGGSYLVIGGSNTATQTSTNDQDLTGRRLLTSRPRIVIARNQVNAVQQTANQNANVGNNNEIEADAVSGGSYLVIGGSNTATQTSTNDQDITGSG